MLLSITEQGVYPTSPSVPVQWVATGVGWCACVWKRAYVWELSDCVLVLVTKMFSILLSPKFSYRCLCKHI